MISHKTYNYLILIALLSNVACVTLSENECHQMDWREKGKVDGFYGRSAQQFATYQEQCMKHGIAGDQKEYASGRKEGLKTFCTRESAYQHGLNGNSYHGVCPSDLEPVFLENYNRGYAEYEIKQKKRKLERKERELRDRERRISEKERSSGYTRY